MERLYVRLPGITPEDPLFQQKKDILQQKGLPLVFSVGFNETRDVCELHFDAMLKAARILNLNEVEWHFIEDDSCGLLSPRNEIEALHLVLSALDYVKNAKEYSPSLDNLVGIAMHKLGSREFDSEICKPGMVCDGDKERKLLSWAQSEGIESNLDIAVFEGFGRGARAAIDIAVNDTLLKIPQHLIICEDTILNTDVYLVLKDKEELSGETKALLWSMRERHDPDSKFAPYFLSLPDSFNTGLSFGTSALQVLDGTMVFEEILQAKEELHVQG